MNLPTIDKPVVAPGLTAPHGENHCVIAVDQSLEAAGVCVAHSGRTPPGAMVLETISPAGNQVGHARTSKVVDRVIALVEEHQPVLVVFEGYDYGSSTNNVAQVAEMVGAIRHHLESHLGFSRGAGCGHNKRERREAATHMRVRDKLIVIQASGSMKKFNLGTGSAKKDESYLPLVKTCTGIDFVDDNQADAYMHVQLATACLAVIRERQPLGRFTPSQQAAIACVVVGEKHLPKGTTLNRFLKMTEPQKLQILKQGPS
jgi:hypothetical protein